MLFFVYCSLAPWCYFSLIILPNMLYLICIALSISNFPNENLKRIWSTCLTISENHENQVYLHLELKWWKQLLTIDGLKIAVLGTGSMLANRVKESEATPNVVINLHNLIGYIRPKSTQLIFKSNLLKFSEHDLSSSKTNQFSKTYQFTCGPVTRSTSNGLTSDQSTFIHPEAHGE